MDFSVLAALSACILTLFVFRWLLVRKKTPPGPWGLPIIGYLPFLSRMPHLDFQRLAKKYGNVFSIRLGARNTIVINDFKSSKEAFAKDAFLGRPDEFPLDLNKETIEKGAFMKLPWMEVRRFSLHTLRDLGLGKSNMDEHIREEIKDLLDIFQQNANKPFCIRDLLASSMSNNIAALVFGKRLNFDDPVRRMMTESINDIVTAADQTGIQIFFPWYGKIAGFLGKATVHNTAKGNTVLKNYIWKEIEEHEKTFDPNNIRDLIDRFLLEMQKRKDDSIFTKRILQDTVYLLFLGGSDTVRVTVEWLVLAVVAHQYAQRRIQDEINETIGRSRLPEGPDQKDMPYTNAFIMEMMRWRTILPLNVIKYTLSDTELNGYFIPKNTLIMPNLWAIHHDPEYWGKDAEEFRPERFLTEDGKALKHNHFMPFSIGRRACPGEPLGKIEVFLYFVSILQRFNIKFPEGKVADFEGKLGGTLVPKLQDIIFIERK